MGNLRQDDEKIEVTPGCGLLTGVRAEGNDPKRSDASTRQRTASCTWRAFGVGQEDEDESADEDVKASLMDLRSEAHMYIPEYE